jgi:hypothetical protein
MKFNVDNFSNLKLVQVQVIGQVLRYLDQKFQVFWNHHWKLIKESTSFQNWIKSWIELGLLSNFE